MDGLTWMRDMINGIEYESMSKKGRNEMMLIKFQSIFNIFLK